MNKNLRQLIISAACLALCMLLPFLTGQIPQIGSMLSPMHIPVLLCGFICGWPYGLAIGAIAPLMRSAMFGMPPIFPAATAMAFEMAIYGLAAGLLYKLLPKKTPYIYVSLIAAMLAGRVVWGVAMACMLGAGFTMSAFVAGAFVNAVPGIILHIILVPAVVLALRKTGIMQNG